MGSLVRIQGTDTFTGDQTLSSDLVRQASCLKWPSQRESSAASAVFYMHQSVIHAVKHAARVDSRHAMSL